MVLSDGAIVLMWLQTLQHFLSVDRFDEHRLGVPPRVVEHCR
jgi:hypothetical protein